MFFLPFEWVFQICIILNNNCNITDVNCTAKQQSGNRVRQEVRVDVSGYL